MTRDNSVFIISVAIELESSAPIQFAGELEMRLIWLLEAHGGSLECESVVARGEKVAPEPD